jgi:hypothetical protein
MTIAGEVPQCLVMKVDRLVVLRNVILKQRGGLVLDLTQWKWINGCKIPCPVWNLQES